MRFNELAAARAAHAAGISPEVIHAGNGMLVSRFVDGRTLTPEAVRQADNLPRIVAIVRRCHHEVPRHLQGPALIFWVFQVIRNYLNLLQARHSNPYAVALAELAARNERLERAVGPVTIVFGHNDLLAANLIDDGQRLWLIDWDYAGFNSPLFDLANLASNNELSPDLETQLLQHYFGESPSRELPPRLPGDEMRVAAARDPVGRGVAPHVHDRIRLCAPTPRITCGASSRRWQQFELNHG